MERVIADKSILPPLSHSKKEELQTCENPQQH